MNARTTSMLLALGLVLVPISAHGQELLRPPEDAPEPTQPQERVVEEIVAWVNGDVITLTELFDWEQQALAGAVQSMEPQDQQNRQKIEEAAEQIRRSVLINLIQNQLLLQEAGQIWELSALEQDMVDNFLRQRGLRTEDDLKKLLEEFGMSREELVRQLMLRQAPREVLQIKVAQTLGVSRDDAIEYYEDNIERFTTPAELVFREIVLRASSPRELETRREEAERIARQAKEGRDFAELVREHSEVPSSERDGRVGPLPPSDLIGQIADAALSLPIGTPSEPIATGAGWHVIQVVERADETVTPFDEVAALCEEEVRNRRIERARDEYVKELWIEAQIEVRERYAERIPAPWNETLEVR